MPTCNTRLCFGAGTFSRERAFSRERQRGGWRATRCALGHPCPSLHLHVLCNAIQAFAFVFYLKTLDRHALRA